jgi:hypothetical protein
MGDAAFVRHLGDLPTRLSRWLTEPMCYKALKARTFAICGTLEWKGSPATLAGVACSGPGGTEAIVPTMILSNAATRTPNCSTASTISIRPRMDVRLSAADCIPL